MLLRWITTGLLHDPYQEFMVKVDDTIEKAALETDFNDDYWERRYTVRRKPSVFEPQIYVCPLSQLRDGSTTAIEARSSTERTIPLQPMPSGDAPDLRPGTDRLPGGACIPPFLEEWKVKILRTGKYLNVIRECGLPVEGEGHPEEDMRLETSAKAVDAVINMDGSKWVSLLVTAQIGN
jgi:gamma-tubulin complex component 2